APTAGLHLTEDLITKLESRGVAIARITLHVGLGTFRPINVEKLADHEMHSEWAELSAESCETINRVRERGGRIVAVGTTTVRTREAAANALNVGRDDPQRPWSGETNLFIRPPYRFKVVDALMTNFHLPKSTLLVLVRTFGGDKLIASAYDEAILEEYRF